LPPKHVGETATVSYAKFSSRSHRAVIRVYDHAGNVIVNARAWRRFQRVVNFWEFTLRSHYEIESSAKS
jgi:hypothetical protein